MGGVLDWAGDFLFGSGPEQTGTAQSPGQAWLQGQLQPLLSKGIQAGLSGQGLYPVQQAPMPNYNIGSYSVPQAPFSSPTDYLQSGELRTAQNLLENFFAGGGGGSAGGGLSGQANTIYGNVLGDLSKGLVGRYNQMQLPYNQMQAQANQNIWQAGVNQGQLGYTGSTLPYYSALNQSYSSPWNLAGLYSGTYGSPIIDPGQQGLVQDALGFGAQAGIGKFFGIF